MIRNLQPTANSLSSDTAPKDTTTRMPHLHSVPTHRLARLLLAAGLALLASTSPWATEPLAPDEAARILESEPAITDQDRLHWAFKPLADPEVPTVDDREWIANAIDAFVLARIEDAGLAPAPQADRATLLRRVTFDLTGLPPTPDEIAAFLASDSDEAYDHVVERLLASPAYGERWAQHWLDLARFAETDGFEHDHLRPNAWRYRDWVIDALNRDMPYDRFVQLQLAGDLLGDDDPSAAIATGFLLAGSDMPDLNLQEERRHNVLNDVASTVGSVFLGLQVGCAQCHDHKYDPISQLDFFRLRAFFESADLFKEHPVPTPQELAAYRLAERERASEWKRLETQIAQLEKAPGDGAARELERLRKALEEVKAHGLPEQPMGRVVRELPRPAPSYLRVRGDFRRLGPAVEPAFLRVVDAGRSTSPASSGEPLPRRLQLADWLTQPDHPLVTRILVNRLWQHHFGRGLVGSSSDFGAMGDNPGNPELLDWLAGELPRGGWSLKHLHRLMVTSSTYRQASAVAHDHPHRASWERALEADPDNDLLARMSRRRLEGEAIRDAMLAASQSLSERRGGPGIRPPLPEELVSTLRKGQWPVSEDEEDHRRRSVYLFVRRNLRYPLFEAFDRPDTNASCAVRSRSTIAPQALILLNSELSYSAARALAGRVLDEASDPAERIDRCYLRLLGRTPSPKERSAALDFLAREQAVAREEQRPQTLPAGTVGVHPQEAALSALCLALLNTNEFVYID